MIRNEFRRKERIEALIASAAKNDSIVILDIQLTKLAERTGKESIEAAAKNNSFVKQ
jgi:hypothetical protein